MPRYQDPGHYGQHAFTAFIHSIFVFCSLQTSTHFDPAQYLKHHTAIARIAAEVAWVADEVEVVVVTLDGARLHDWVPGRRLGLNCQKYVAHI